MSAALGEQHSQPLALMSLLASNSRPESTAVLLAKILDMVVQNGIAVALRQERQFSVHRLNELRARLLQDAFFDPQHRPEELRPFRTNPRGILWKDLVVLLSRMMRVAMRREPLSKESQEERVVVRNEALDHPFFDRSKPPSLHPFAVEEPEDEGVCC